MKRAVIVGAGIAGLATALRLGQDGWRTVVVERAPARRSSGYMVNLIGSGYDAAERLGLLSALSAYDLGLFTTVLVRADGRPKFTVPSAIAEAALGKRAMSVFRGELESTLYEAVRDRTEIRSPDTARPSRSPERTSSAPHCSSTTTTRQRHWPSGKQDCARKPPNGRHSPAAECSNTRHPASSTYG